MRSTPNRLLSHYNPQLFLCKGICPTIQNDQWKAALHPSAVYGNEQRSTIDGTACPSCRRFPLSSLLLTNYTNLTFEHFASRPFDFADIRRRMKELERGQNETECRMNVRKFLTAFFLELKRI
ncbi:hypothetical protein ETC03_15965 [Geobacillus sp. MMMUD3]|nr:hypothetical protein [Geobacillus sp. MMMUD3]